MLKLLVSVGVVTLSYFLIYKLAPEPKPKLIESDLDEIVLDDYEIAISS